jgi:hypothetical protein
MVRVIAFLGLLAGFLALSPSLRDSAGNLAVQALSCLNAYSPFSYVAVAAAAVAITFRLARSVFANR